MIAAGWDVITLASEAAALRLTGTASLFDVVTLVGVGGLFPDDADIFRAELS